MTTDQHAGWEQGHRDGIAAAEFGIPFEDPTERAPRYRQGYANGYAQATRPVSPITTARLNEVTR